MLWIYGLIVLLIIVVLLYYRYKDIELVRVFGFDLIKLLFLSLLLILLLGEEVLPMPGYYIKARKETSLNQILEEETLKAGIEFEGESFKILDSYGMHFNHLFLASYELEGEEEVRFYHFKKNILGNMKPESFIEDYHIIKKSSEEDNYFNSYVPDGLFGGYLVTAGYGDEDSEPRSYGLGKYRITKTPEEGYFLWVEMAVDNLLKILILSLIFILVLIYERKNKRTRSFYKKWNRDDGIVEIN